MYNKLIKLLFLNEQTQKFLCNDLFQEFLLVIPTEFCISKKNINNKVREINYLKVKNIIEIFLNTNKIYLIKLLNVFKFKDINSLIEHLIICYLFYISKITPSLKNINVFTSKLSIGYNKYNYLIAI